MKRHIIPFVAFLLGFIFMAGSYFGILPWAQGWEYVVDQFLRNRWYILPIFVTFGIETGLYSVLRFRLLKTSHTGIMMGTSGGSAVTALVACCLHHVTDVLPILGISAIAAFLTRYQRPFMLVSLGLNFIGITAMLFILYRERRRLNPTTKNQPVLEIE